MGLNFQFSVLVDLAPLGRHVKGCYVGSEHGMGFGMKIGWVEKRRAYAVSTQRDALIADGVPEGKIYDGATEPREAAIRDAGERGILTIYRLSCLARDRKDWQNFVLELEYAGIEHLTIREVWHDAGPRESRMPRDVGAMLADAFADWAQNHQSPAEAKKHGRRGAKRRWAGLERMNIREARKVWADTAAYMRIEDALAAMPGWSRSSAMRRLGKRGTGVQLAKTGPKRKK